MRGGDRTHGEYAFRVTTTGDPFAAFVPRVAARWPEEAEPWRVVEGSLVFSDVSGFTALSERLAKRGKLGAEQMTDLLDAVFERLLAEAIDLGGDLLAFGGDALCLLFDGPDHPVRAATAATALQRALRARTPAHAAVGGISLGMSIGCHQGPVHLMRVGSSYRQLLAIGPTVSTTLSFEGAADRGEVLVSSAFARDLPDGSVGPLDREGHLLLRAPTPAAMTVVVGEAEPVDPRLIAPRIRPQLREGAPAEHRPATVAFVKAEGTDELIATMGLESVHAELDALVSAMQDIADRYEVCMLDPDVYPDAIKFLVAAGVPTATADDADRMLEAAREMVAVDTRLVLRAGVNRGRVFAGPVGGPTRRSYTVIGDTVNLAARLMAHAPPRTVLAPETLLDRTRTQFARTPLEPFLVKGKTEPIRAAVVGDPGAGSHWDHSGRGPLIGRDHEHRVLMDAWTAAQQHRGAVIELVGEPGIGKSRLLAELVSHTDGGPAFVAEGGVYAAASPYRALITGLCQIVGIELEAPELEQGRGLARFIADRAPQLEPWLPLIAIAFGIDLPATAETRDLAPEFRRARLAELFVEFLAAVCPGRALLIIEDAHWLDEPSQELLTALARSAPERPWLIVITRRPDPTGLILADDIVATRLELAPLDSEAAADLARSELEDAMLPAQTIDALIARAAGNPFFLTELLQAAKGGQDIDALPESMELLIAAGIDTLDPHDRQVLRQASVLGREFPARLLRDLVDTNGLDAVLQRLERFLERDRDSLRFRHALLRQTAYEGLPFRARAELHLRAATRLESDAGEHSDEDAEILSLHFFHGRSFDRALHYSSVAGERAQTDLAPVEAAVFYRRALDAARALRTVVPGERARLEESLADVEERASHYELARASLRRARQLVRDDVAKARLLQKDSWIEGRLGRLSQALSLNARALRRIEGTRKPEAAGLRAELRVARAGIRQRQGRWDESIVILRAELAHTTRSRSTATLARAHFLLYTALSERGDSAGIIHARKAIGLFEECGDLYGQSGVYNNLGVEAYYVGNWSEALEHYQRAQELARRIGDVVEAATANVNLGEILLDQGAFGDAEAAFTDALQVFRGARFVFGIAYASSDLGRLRVRMGELESARELFDVASDQFGVMGGHIEALETKGRRAEAFLAEGQPEAALDVCATTLRDTASGGDYAMLEAWLERLSGAACFQLSDAEAARTHWRAALRAAEIAGADFERALTLESLALLDGTESTEAAATLARLGIRTTITDLLLRGAPAAAPAISA